MASRWPAGYVELQVRPIAVVGPVRVYLASVDELLGDQFVDAEVNQDHQFERVLDVVFLASR